MLELCKINRLKFIREKPQGIYLGDDSGEDVLLPRAEVPAGVRIGNELDVFLYLDSSDRLTATLRTPNICLDRMAVLEVVQVTEIGVFLDWGLEKNLLLPFKEVTLPLEYDPIKKASGQVNVTDESDVRPAICAGMRLPVMLYVDRTGRPAATMHIYDRLTVGEKYVKDSAIEGTVIQINPEFGVFVAVDNRYFGMININEISKKVNVGDRIFGRVSNVRPDGKYMISLTQKAHLQMDNDALIIMTRLTESGGCLPIGDKSDAAVIMRELGMSKKAFKRAVGQLYKAGKVTPGAEQIVLR